MPRLVVLSEGFSGRAHELKAEITTVGRIEDNIFQVPDPSVSSHHCEIRLKGGEVTVKDLGSTNGSYINGHQITEAVLKPSQILRLGQIEIRFESNLPTGPMPKKILDHTQIVPQGIKLDDLDKVNRPATHNPAFIKKNNVATKIFIVVAIVVGIAIIAFGVWAIGFQH
ncbi:MAG: FHA domain-containing protein [Pedosphaera sp.]|nr:FHA domain-containing protein [Pedosphaera sp.]